MWVGRGTWRQIIEQRVQALYPSMNEAQMEGYLRERNLADDQWLKALETEFKQLDSSLSRWLMEAPRAPARPTPTEGVAQAVIGQALRPTEKRRALRPHAQNPA